MKDSLKKNGKRAKNKKTSGFSLLEVVIAASVLLIIFVSIIAAHNSFIKISLNSVPLVKSSYLIEEGVEAIKILRDTSWSTHIAPLSSGINYYLTFNGATFVTTQAQSYIDGQYDRVVTVAPVYRDGSGDIQASGTLDQNTKKITVTVSWYTGSGTSTKQLSTYITNLFGN